LTTAPRPPRRFNPLLLHPFLIAAAAVLALAATPGEGEYRLGELPGVLLAVVAGVAAVYLVLLLVTRRPPAAALLTTVVVVWVFYSLPAMESILGRDSASAAFSSLRSPATLGLALAGVAALGAAYWVSRRAALAARVNAVLGIAGLLMVLRFGAEVLWDQHTRDRWIAASDQVRLATAPIEAGTPAVADRPDIYLLLLDSYPDRETLRRYYGHDNGGFEDSLRALSFVVPERVRASYPQTNLVLASLLNASELDEFGDDARPGTMDRSLLYHLVEHNRVARFVREQGYRYVFIPSSWWTATAASEQADTVVEGGRGNRFADLVGRTNFRRLLLGKTLLRVIPAAVPRGDPARERWSLARLAEIARLPEPTFTFVHLMVPHPPYVFDAACRPLLGEPTFTTVALIHAYADTAGFADQVKCVNRLVLEAMAELRRTSPEPPVVLIQGDHGTAIRDQVLRPADAVSPEELRERLAAFGAYSLPGGGETAFGDSVTTTNVLRNVLRYYLGAELPPLAPRTFWASYADQYHPVEVNAP
jgi:hypothetical protein